LPATGEEDEMRSVTRLMACLMLFAAACVAEVPEDGMGTANQDLFEVEDKCSICGGPATVAITSPPNGGTVAGVVPIATATSASVTRVDFYADSVPIGSDLTAPFALDWDTRVNALPAPNHPMDLGYYFVEWKIPSTFAAARGETNAYTNTYYASLATYSTDHPEQYGALLEQSMSTAVAEGRRIHLNVELSSPFFTQYLDTVLDVAAQHWQNVVRVELADEPSWSLATTNQMIALVDQKLAERGLTRPPGGYGIVYVYTQPIPAAAAAPGLAWVGIEAYLDFPGSPDSETNIALLRQRVTTAINQVPAGKNIVLVPMAYDRNGQWTNIDTLRDLQVPTYLLAYNDPRVIALNMFSYTRQGGSRDHPELRTPHRLMGEKMLNRTVPCAVDGPRTLRAVATAADGTTASARIVVTVANGCVLPPVPWFVGGLMVIDPPPGQTTQIFHDVADQTSGRHRLSFRVKVDGGVNASMAKIEVRTDPSTGWDKLAQIYFGTSMRLNYDPNGAAATVVPATAQGSWYNIALDIDLDHDWIDVRVNGTVVATHVPVRNGPITALQFAGWDLPGSVTLDEVKGERLP
jgi:hypothetical protein